MANRTVKDARSVKGTNPQYLIEKIIRSRIYECRYWKEECFALSAELLVDKALQLRYVGGVVDGNIKPTPFLCLILKMLQIQPEKDIIVEFISQHDFKYVRALGAFYMRLVGTSLDSYKYLEPLYLDYRKVRRLTRTGAFELVFMDEFIDELLREERLCDTILPRIQKRHVLEENNQLESRVSALDDDIEGMEEEEEDDDEEETSNAKEKTVVPPAPDRHDNSRDKSRASPPARHRRSRSPHARRPAPTRGELEHRDRGERGGDHAVRDRDRDRPRERDRHHRHRRHRSRSRDKHKASSGHRHRHEHDNNSDDRRRRHGNSGSGRRDKKDDDVREANELRAKLGIAPLRT